MKKLKLHVKDNWPLYIIIIISIVLHILVTKELGFEYTLSSDDLSYVNSGITFAETGKVTMHGVISAQIMPGMTFLIALLVLIFGKGIMLWISLKVLWTLFGILTILFVYKSIRLYANKYVSAIPCLFFLSLNYMWMDNLILSETPFIFLFSLLIYLTLKISIKPSIKNYVFIVITYIAAVFIRPNIGIYPIFLFLFLILKKYDFKLLIKQCVIAGIILLICLTPWTYRNYKIYNKFIPLTFGIGNPLLLGTYQGIGYPTDESLDYVENLDSKMSEKMKQYLDDSRPRDQYTVYYSLEYDKLKAEYRMQEWWKLDKKSMILSYCFYKPKIMVYSLFYWKEVLNVSANTLIQFLKIELIIFIISILLVLINKKYFKELLFLIMVYGSQIALYSYTFAFDRYAISLFFIRYIIIGLGLASLYEIIKKKRGKNENINDNSCL